MDSENLPQQHFSREEINRCFLRWQQLRQQHGEAVQNNPEFLYITKVLRHAARQQQQQETRPNVTTEEGASEPPFTEAAAVQASMQNGGEGMQHTPRPELRAQNSETDAVKQQQLQLLEQQPLFSPYHSNLLKHQMATLRVLLRGVAVPQESQQALGMALRNAPSPQQLLKPLSPDFNGPGSASMPAGTPTMQDAMARASVSTGMGISGTTPMGTGTTPAGLGTPLAVTAATPGNSVASVQVASTANTPNTSASETPAVPREPPVQLATYKQLHPDVELATTRDPMQIVDSFSLPEQPESVEYSSLFHDPASSKRQTIIPGVFPEGVDIHASHQIYQTKVALEMDATLEALALAVDSPDDEKLYDYYALQLLPLQKAVRGHYLSFDWYQQSLLPNTHPNFLSKIRKLKVTDSLITNELYLQQETLQKKMLQKEKNDMVEHKVQFAWDTYRLRHSKREQRLKFGNKIVTFHNNAEREESKRMERNAKQRLQALKANDEEAYIKLLDQTKDTRITFLLKQTNTFLDSLTMAVKDQQATHAEPAQADEADEGELKDEEEEVKDYYNVAHRIKEEVTRQPSILVGGTLKEYQLKGLQWMVSLYNNHLNGILADEMGLGKTIQSISLLTYLVEVKQVQGPFLVIVPLSTLTNWNAEFDKWAPALRKITYKGVPNERKALQPRVRAGDFTVLLTTFEYIIKDRPLLSKIRWVHMIIDEGHRMKNAQSKLSSTLTTYYHTDYRLILTGTPLQNNLPELWALLNFVLPKIFNSVKSFDEWFNTPFANTGGQDKIELSEEETLLVIRRLHKVLRPFLLRRLKIDVEKDLPDKIETVLKCKMSALQSKMYEQMLKYNRLFIGDSATKKMVGLKGFNNQIMQLRKICNHPYVFEEVEDAINPQRETNDDIWRVAGKFELLERILPKFKASGHRVLIFFQMTQIMDIMEDFLRYMNLKYMRLDGSTKSDDRTALLKLFNAPDSEYFCFLLSTRAGGLGLNLQTADTVIIFDTDWNPHQDLQAQDRAHRIGQKNEVRILRLITQNSVEEVILERAQMKLDIDGKVIQAGKFDNKSTSEEQEALLRQLLENEEKSKHEETDDLDDEDLNEILARGDHELNLFQQMDRERQFNGPRLYIEAELPEIYKRDIDEELKKEISTAVYGRGARERKSIRFDDNVSEEQWLKELEASDEEPPQPVRPVKKRKTARKGVFSRHGNPEVNIELRKAFANRAQMLYDMVVDYTNHEGRRLGDAFVVKPPKKFYPDYYMLIKYPVALETVAKHAKDLAYNSEEEVFQDFHLIFKNATVYNQEGSTIYNDALELDHLVMSQAHMHLDFIAFDEQFGTKPLIPQQPFPLP